MAKRVYDYDTVYAALCLWEEIVSPTGSTEATRPWQDYREENGTSGLRDTVINRLAGPCDAAWTRAHARFEADYSAWNQQRQALAPHVGDRLAYETWLASNPAPEEPGAFDWEFVPFWLRACVDWSGDEPRVLGSTTMSENVS